MYFLQFIKGEVAYIKNVYFSETITILRDDGVGRKKQDIPPLSTIERDANLTEAGQYVLK